MFYNNRIVSVNIYMISKSLALNDGSFKNSLGEIFSPSEIIIIVLSDISLVLRCIILFIVGKGTPLN